MNVSSSRTISIRHSADVSEARKAAKSISEELGFSPVESEEINIVVNELGSNLIKHATEGCLVFATIADGTRVGIKIESRDNGPGIEDVEQVFTDGYSTASSLGCGLGAVNRMMDELAVESIASGIPGTYILAKKWKRHTSSNTVPVPMEIGAATRPHPRMQVNGDAFVIKRWDRYVLAAVIDGLGHGHLAHRAAHTARRYIENHYDQPLESIFAGVSLASRSTRGLVMAVALFILPENETEKPIKLHFASIGNITLRVYGPEFQPAIKIRRGIIGFNAPKPLVTEHDWDPNYLMVLHTDGIRSNWRWDDFTSLSEISAASAAHLLLQGLAKDEDDATVIVVKKVRISYESNCS